MKRTPLQTGDANVPKEKSALRERPLMKWLNTSEELDAIAKRRVLMILSVLSGELPVTQAIAQAGITRPLYYVLERRAVEAMLLAVMPGAEMPGSQNLTSQGKIRHLEGQIERLEREKRRLQRLLFLTRKVLGSGPYKTKTGGPRTMRGKKISSAPASIPNGKPTSKRSPQRKKATSTSEPSIPNKDGAAEPSPGTES
jgi:hypothetical protein